MRAVYADLPGVKVEPLRFTSADISGERLLAMMKVDDSESKLFNPPTDLSSHKHSDMMTEMPLYMEVIMNLLRDMEVFSYKRFRAMLARQNLNRSQKAMLDLRLSLLDSCLKGGDEGNSVTKHFKQGALTIVE